MKIAIVGSRDWPKKDWVYNHVYGLDAGTVIVSGGCLGVDTWAAQAAKERGLQVIEFLPDWNTYGKSAGYKRNVQIVEASNEVVAFQFNKSKGTQHTIDIAHKLGKHVFVFELP